jgi:hypothetical protein
MLNPVSVMLSLLTFRQETSRKYEVTEFKTICIVYKSNSESGLDID